MRTASEAISITGAEKRPFPGAVSPMLLHAEKEPFSKEGWIFEPKLDGMRAIALLSDGACTLLSKTGRNLNATFPEIVQALSGHDEELVFDGEIVVVSPDGKPDFEALQARWSLTKERDVKYAQVRAPVAYYVFDVLHFARHDLSRCKLIDRKAVLSDSVPKSSIIRSISFFDDGCSLYEACREQRLEGIVAKRKDSWYRSGARSKDWIKIKFTQTGNFIIVGYRKDDGFLVVEAGAKNGKIVGAVQFGFSNKDYERLLSRLKPSDVQPLGKNSKSDVVWFEPEVCVTLEFMEWTGSHLLRFPVFRGFAT